MKAQLEESKRQTLTMKEQMAKMFDKIKEQKESQLKIIELLNNPAMIKNIRANPQEYLAAGHVADIDTAKQKRGTKADYVV
jgi:hypothetical protein